MKQIFHPYHLWEDHKNGFYDTQCNDKDVKFKSVIRMFSSQKTTTKFMDRVIKEWVYSCEHNLSNDSMNKIAYIGQAACCIYDNVPSIITMNAWKHVSIENRMAADEIAKQTINKWMQNQKSKNILRNGKVEGIQRGYQTKLHFAWKKEV